MTSTAFANTNLHTRILAINDWQWIDHEEAFMYSLLYFITSLTVLVKVDEHWEIVPKNAKTLEEQTSTVCGKEF